MDINGDLKNKLYFKGNSIMIPQESEELELKNSLLLLSGGLDSVTLFHMLNDTDIPFQCLIVDYGQPAKKEINYAKKLCKTNKIHYECFYLDKKLFFRNRKKGDKTLGVLPNRNGVLLSIAVTYALQNNIQNIYYGAIGNTNRAFCDCQPPFLRKFNDLLSVSDLATVRIKAPFIYKNKEYVTEKALELGVNIMDCWSCDINESKPCGQCDSCKDRMDTEKKLKKKLLKEIQLLNKSLVNYR